MKKIVYVLMMISIGFSSNSSGMFNRKQLQLMSFPIKQAAFLAKNPFNATSNKRSLFTQSFSHIKRSFKKNHAYYVRNILLGTTTASFGCFSIDDFDTTFDSNLPDFKEKSGEHNPFPKITISSLEDLSKLLNTHTKPEIIINIATNQLGIREYDLTIWQKIKAIIEECNNEDLSNIVNGIITHINTISVKKNNQFWKHVMVTVFERCSPSEKETLIKTVQECCNQITMNQSFRLWDNFLPYLLEDQTINKAIKDSFIDTLIIHFDNVLHNASQSVSGKYFPVVLWASANPKQREKLLKQITNNITILKKSDEDIWDTFLTPIFIEANNITRKTIVNAVSAHFDELSTVKAWPFWNTFLPTLLTYSDTQCKTSIINASIPQLKTIFKNARDFETLPKNYFPIVLWQESSNAQRNQIANILINDFSSIVQSPQDPVHLLSFLCKVFTESPYEHKISLIDVTIKNFKKIGRFSNELFADINPYISLSWESANLEQREKFIRKIIENPNLFTYKIYPYFLFKNFLPKVLNDVSSDNKQALLKSTLTQNHLQNKDIIIPFLEKLNQSSLEICIEHLHHNPSLFPKESLTALDNPLMNTVIRHSSCQQLMQLYAHHDLAALGTIIMHTLKDTCSCSEQYPTLQHIKNNKTLLEKDNYYRQYIVVPSLQRFISNVITKEKELHDQGFVTFYHGQRWEYNFLLEWYKKLWAISHNKEEDELKEFIFAHARPYCDDKECFDKEHAVQQHLLRNGRETEADRAHLLFTNYAFFANTSNSGSSTSLYFYQNTNVHNTRLSFENIFRWFNFSDIYEHFKDKFAVLEENHDYLTKYGNLLMFAIPKKQLEQNVYECISRGPKATNFQESTVAQTLERLTKTQKSHVGFDNTDAREFCIPMTQNKEGALNPESGIKVFSFNAASQTKYAQYKEQEAQLWQEVKEAIAQKQKQTNTKTTI